MNIMRNTAALAATLVIASPLAAHHSDAGMDMESIVAFEGTVTEFAWRNPHVYVVVETEQSGEPSSGSCRWGRSTSSRVAAGDAIPWFRAMRSPLERPNGERAAYGLLRDIDKEGFSLAATADAPEVTPPATSLAGIWQTDRSTVQRYPGGFDGFFHALLTLNDKGREAQAAYDALSAENPSRPVSADRRRPPSSRRASISWKLT